jgi:two-component system chemotaxis response regulator CheY
MKILVAEDSITSVHYIRKILKNNIENLELDIVENGKLALSKLNQKKYHLILLDWNMPIKNGFDVLVELQSPRQLNYKIPIIMVTTEGRRQEVISAIKLGVKGYVVKPYTEDQLVSAIEVVVNDFY